jgi:hypothetical protein
MSDRPSHLNTNPPPPPSSTPTSNAPFTPRSSTFPDGLDSDDEDFFVPTPTQSPDAGPHYDDLPPTYDEAQQQALRDARNGVSPVNPETIDVQRLQLDNSGVYQIPASADVRAHRATAAELEQERKDRAVPVQHVGGSENVVVGRVGPVIVDPVAKLLSTALEFTKHEPDADTQYAPRLARCVAIPQTSSSTGRKGKGKQRESGWRRSGRGRGGRAGCGNQHVPGQWPDTSSETLAVGINGEGEPVEFLRAYAKALHAHSIRPAEFLDFLDGLNALCAATGITPADIIDDEMSNNSPVGLIQNYINAVNESFFAPRGLKVHIKSLATLLDVAKIPEERGQRAGAVASVLDEATTPANRAQALHPWIEALETNVPEPSTSALVMKDMVSRLRRPSLTENQSSSADRIDGSEATRTESDGPPHSVPRAEEDPPHSIPGAFPAGSQDNSQGPTWPPFSGWQGRGGRDWSGQRGQQWGPFGAPGNGPFGPPGNGPFGAGRGPFGAPGNGPFGRPRNGPWGRGRSGHGCGAQSRGQPQNGWEAWGRNIGKWGEDFGRRMEVWGEQVGRNAQAWGEDVGRNAQSWGEDVAARASGDVGGVSANGYGERQSQQQSGEPHAAEHGTTNGQETGVHQEKNGDKSVDAKLHTNEKVGTKAKPEDNDDDDDDASTISSDSDSDSSDSDSDSDEKSYPNTTALYQTRISAINAAAQSAHLKGKKSPAAISLERSTAIERATRDKTALDNKIEAKKTKRAILRGFRERKRELRREYRGKRRALKREGKGKKTREWKEMRRWFRERKRELKREKWEVKRDIREARWEGKRRAREEPSGDFVGGGMGGVWVVVENLSKGKV